MAKATGADHLNVFVYYCVSSFFPKSCFGLTDPRQSKLTNFSPAPKVGLKHNEILKNNECLSLFILLLVFEPLGPTRC